MIIQERRNEMMGTPQKMRLDGRTALIIGQGNSWLPELADAFADAGAIIRGYNSVRPLTALERELLPELVLGRICSSVLHAAHGASRDPDNEYLQISAAPMWRLLELLTSRRTDLSRAVETACS